MTSLLSSIGSIGSYFFGTAPSIDPAVKVSIYHDLLHRLEMCKMDEAEGYGSQQTEADVQNLEFVRREYDAAVDFHLRTEDDRAEYDAVRRGIEGESHYVNNVSAYDYGTFASVEVAKALLTEIMKAHGIDENSETEVITAWLEREIRKLCEKDTSGGPTICQALTNQNPRYSPTMSTLYSSVLPLTMLTLLSDYQNMSTHQDSGAAAAVQLEAALQEVSAAVTHYHRAWPTSTKSDINVSDAIRRRPGKEAREAGDHLRKVVGSLPATVEKVAASMGLQV